MGNCATKKNISININELNELKKENKNMKDRNTILIDENIKLEKENKNMKDTNITLIDKNIKQNKDLEKKSISLTNLKSHIDKLKELFKTKIDIEN